MSLKPEAMRVINLRMGEIAGISAESWGDTPAFFAVRRLPDAAQIALDFIDSEDGTRYWNPALEIKQAAWVLSKLPPYQQELVIEAVCHDKMPCYILQAPAHEICRAIISAWTSNASDHNEAPDWTH